MNAHVARRQQAAAAEALHRVREQVGRWLRRLANGTRRILEAHGAQRGETAVRLHLGARRFTAEDVAAAWRSHGAGVDLAEARRRSSFVRALAPPAPDAADVEDLGPQREELQKMPTE